MPRLRFFGVTREAAEKVVLYQGTASSRAASVPFCFAALAAEVRLARGTGFFGTHSSRRDFFLTN
jgi:hypothetical protein